MELAWDSMGLGGSQADR